MVHQHRPRRVLRRVQRRVALGLPDAQQLVVAEKDLNGRVTTKEIMGVLFSLLEGPDQPAMRAS